MVDRTTKSKGPWRVNIIESEAGWGTKVDEVIEFATLDEATEYVTTYNDKYNPKLGGGTVPDWYMIAESPYKI